jgi:uncharacterized protein (TIGR01244 family)
MLLLLLLSGCSDGGSAPGKDAPAGPAKDGSKPQSAEKLQPATIGSFKAQRFGGVYLAGQPGEEDFKQFDAAGVKTVINLRAAGENKDFDEAKLLSELGMMYHNPGFNSPQTLSDPIFRRVRDLLNNKKNEPVLLHCASGNRVGALWLAHRVIDDGIPYDQALEEARAIGMKPAFEARVKEYIDSKPE